MPSTPAYVHQAARALADRHQPATRNEYGACTAPGYVVGPGSEDRARVHHQLPPADLTDPNRPSSRERWEEQRARVAEYATTLEAAGWTVVRKEVLTGPILLATPPAKPTPEQELADLLEQTITFPSQMRRLAELVELVHGLDEARPHFERAAAAGDQDAADYLAQLRDEEELTPEETGERENSLLYWLGPRTDAAADTWPCPRCEDGYASRLALRVHLAEDHGEDPDDFTLAPYREAGQ